MTDFAEYPAKASERSEEMFSEYRALDFTPEKEKFAEKESIIRSILSTNKEDLPSLLKELAISKGGLINDELRAKAWPLMLGITDMSNPPAPDENELKNHPEYQQVKLDVDRSLKRFPPGIPLEKRLSLQNQLTRLILRVVIAHPRLSYYQGYHDVAVTLLLVTGENAAYFLLEHLSTNHLQDCMAPTMEKTSYLLNYIPPLVRRQNEDLYKYMEKSDVGTMFALSWFLTWFGHNLPLYKDVVRLYDFFLASPPHTPLYLSAVIICYRSEEIFNTPCDMASIHQLLANIPDDLPFEELLCKTCRLYDKHPPKQIEIEVVERCENERKQREREMYPKRKNKSSNWWMLPRRLPYWLFLGRQRPMQRFFMLAVAVGLYAYYFQAVEGFLVL